VAKPAGPIVAKAGVIEVPAAALAETGGQISWGGQFPNVLVHADPLGGRQIHFQAHMQSQWADYAVDVPAEGDYEVMMTASCINDDQVLEVVAAGAEPVKVAIPLTYGLWGEAPPVVIHLAKGVQTIRVQTPVNDPKRGISLRRFVLKPKA